MSTISNRVIPAASAAPPRKGPSVLAPALAIPRRWDWGRAVQVLLGVELVLVLALAQVMFAGYRVGVGNQSIQIPFLKHWMDPQLFAADPVVQKTLADYPSMFFKGLAKVVGVADAWLPAAKPGAARPVDPLLSVYFWLHVLTAAAVFACAYKLGRAMFNGSRAAGAALVLLLACGHHRALAGDELYSIGFTHTWAVFPLAIGALALLYAGRYVWAFALVGVMFNLHALTAAYLMVMFCAWGALEIRRQPGWAWRLALCVGVFAILAAPTALEMLANKQQWTPDWLEKTRIRSADHSFPSVWWVQGGLDVPRFLLLAGLAAVAMSWTPDPRVRRKSLLMLAGVAFLFVVGILFTELWPKATVIRAQLFRASRLAMVLMLAHVAGGIVAGIRAGGWGRWFVGRTPPAQTGYRGSGDRPAAGDPTWSIARERVGVTGWLELLVAVATFACVAVPGLFALAPWVLLAAVGVAIANGRLSWGQAAVACAALLATVLAARTIEFHIPGIDSAVSVERVTRAAAEAGPMLALAAAVALAVWAIMRLRVGPRAKLCALVAACVGVTVLGVDGYRKRAYAGVTKEDPWVVAQLWVARNTPTDAVVLVPPDKGGFRVLSDRAVVAEWRDGTQLYFTAAFAQEWWARLMATRPAVYDAKGKELSRGKGIEKMTDGEVEAVAKQYGATLAVLPSGQERPGFRKLFDTADLLPGAPEAWAVYRPVVLNDEDQFLEQAREDIVKYRTSEAKVEVVGADGKPLAGVDVSVRHVRHAFLFGVSIPPFEDSSGLESPEWTAPQVTEKQLAAVKGVFNFSMIPFSAKWNWLEPTEGARRYEELDKYVDWCTRNGIVMEFHYLSGFMPTWARARYRSDPESVRRAWEKFCLDTVDRYQDRIPYWQVVNDGRLGEWAGDLIKKVRAKHPHLKLGISDCSAFWYPGFDAKSPGDLSRTQILRGLADLQSLQAAGAPVDFFATHGHKPHGVYPDFRGIHVAFDAWAAHGVKLQVTEATMDLGLKITGPGKSGQWDAEKAADFWERYYTAVFSHPACEALNYWDLGESVVRANPAAMAMGLGGTGQAGLLDPKNDFAPRVTYLRIKKLITEDWSTKFTATTGGDGQVPYAGRYFHGDYEITAKVDGRELKGKFTVKPGEKNEIKVKVKVE
ncbi:MAG TPA: endo-1,4-beta-xylanase [Tepidisphaeraceae bacterium]|nr:endo-1,4-beta-xylanase [Tepidisphaeraceae bacterium]